jgi:hypothetical protein
MFWYDDYTGMCLPNIIRENTYGIDVKGTSFTGLNNSHTQIYNNNLLDIINDNPFQLKAEMCWWGSSTPSYPYSLKFIGSVDYEPWANTPNCSSTTTSKIDEIALYQKDIEKNPDDPASRSKLSIVVNHFYQNGRSAEVVPYIEGISNRHKGKNVEIFALWLTIPYLQREGKNTEVLNRSLAIMQNSSTDLEIRKLVLLNLGYLYKYNFDDKTNAIKSFTQYLSEYPDDGSSWIARAELDDMGGNFSQPQPAISSKGRSNLQNSFCLGQNYPNPFNPQTTINYGLSTRGNVSLRIYSITGELIKTLVNDEHDTGYYSVLWNGKDEYNNDVPSGIYFYIWTHFLLGFLNNEYQTRNIEQGMDRIKLLHSLFLVHYSIFLNLKIPTNFESLLYL